jgi:hypothetical protein
MELTVTLRLSSTEADVLAAMLSCGESRPLSRRSGHDRKTVASTASRLRYQLAKQIPAKFSATVAESRKARP